MRSMLMQLLRLAARPLVWLAAAIFLLEEFIWDQTAALMARLGAVRAVHAVERRIARLPARWALLAFILPSLIFVPAKLLGLHAIAAGHWLVGSGIFLFAKVAGFALFSRIFNLTRPALLQLAWFARLHGWVMYYRNRIHAYLDSWEAFQQIRQRLRALRERIRLGLRKLASREAE